MAYTSVLPVHRLERSIDYVKDRTKTTKSAGSLEEAIDYACNREKTEETIFEDAMGCTCENAYADMVKTKVETFSNAEAKNVTVTEVHELSDLIAEYEGTENSSPYGSHPADTPSLGSTSMELAMSVDTGASDIRPVNVAKPTGATGKPKIMKRSVIRVTMELEVQMETKQYLQFLQQIPDLFSLHEFPNLRCRVICNQKKATINEEPAPVEVKVLDDRKYQRWFVAFTLLMVCCMGGIIALFFSIPNLYKQDIHFLRNDTIHQEFSISNSRIDLKDVSLTNHGGKDTLVIKDKKIIIAK